MSYESLRHLGAAVRFVVSHFANPHLARDVAKAAGVSECPAGLLPRLVRRAFVAILSRAGQRVPRNHLSTTIDDAANEAQVSSG